ncbi:MAG: nitronate monooxygenase [Arenicella sp.]|jgi:nitronate monooxygenase|nr:nitronate monooxygenase [Arenicella sp.]
MTELSKLFGVDVPLVQGPMGEISGPKLVAAVANAGGLGVLPLWAESGERARAMIETTQSETPRSFAVNLRSDLIQVDHVALAADLGVSTFHLFWGDPSKTAVAVRERKCEFFSTIGDVESAKRHIDAGACCLVAQGTEAGGARFG